VVYSTEYTYLPILYWNILLHRLFQFQNFRQIGEHFTDLRIKSQFTSIISEHEQYCVVYSTEYLPILYWSILLHRVFQFQYSRLTLLRNFILVLKLTLRRLFVFSHYLMKPTCFSLTGHHHVYRPLDENCCFIMLSCYEF
jgi:hypothetical protein